jgi:protocatechuate 3,4-dioxygenase beta subunit
MRICGIGWLLVLFAVTDATAAQRLRGVVYAADGTPAAGAVVWAAKPWPPGPLERRETTADANGRCALDLEPGDWFVWARRGTQGGEGPNRHDKVHIVAGQEPEAIAIRLEERGTFRGRLLEAETGKPIAAGRLFLDAGLILTADAAGRFEIGGLSRGYHESVVVAPGRQRLRVLFDTVGRADTELDIPVPRSARIVGRVTDADGKPIPGAWVCRLTSGNSISNRGLVQTCDGEGRFEYDDAVPPDQPTRLTAGAPGYSREDRDELLIAPGDKPIEVNISLRPLAEVRPNPPAPAEKSRVVSGVVRGPDGKPVARVLLSWPREPGAFPSETRTDAEGRFRITVPDRDGVLRVLPRSFQPDFLPLAGGERKLEVKLRAGHTVRGRVLDDLGNPLKNVQVLPVAPPGLQVHIDFLSEAAVRTDADGKFELKGVPDGAKFDFEKWGLTEVHNHTLDLNGADNTVTMQYGGMDSGAVVGRVVDRAGQPIRNFRLLVSTPRERRQGDQIGAYFAGYCGIGVRFTSADGSFVLTGLEAGTVCRIMVMAEGHGEAVADRVTAVTLNRVREAQPVTVQAGPPAALRVRVLTATGKPIPDARVMLVNGEARLDEAFMWGYHNASWEDMVRARTGADGWADFPSLSFTGATVLVQAPGSARQRIAWRNGQQELKVEMAPEAVIAGEVRDLTGRPVRVGLVTLLSGGDQISTTILDGKGCFRVAELPAGIWTVQADGAAEAVQVFVTAGQTKEVRFRVRE